MGKKDKNVCATLNYTENFLASTIIGFISIFAFASLAGITIATITAEFNKYKSIIKKKKKKHDKTVFSPKFKLNKIEVLFFKSLIVSVISHDEFLLGNNVLKIKRNKRRNKKSKDLIMFIEDFSIFIKQCYYIVWSGENIQKVKIQKLQEQKTGE